MPKHRLVTDRTLNGRFTAAEEMLAMGGRSHQLTDANSSTATSSFPDIRVAL